MLEPKHHAIPEPATEGVIDLDPQAPIQAKTEYRVPNHVGETVVLQPGQKAKRKYTKRAKKTAGVTVTPTFIDRAAIRAARIQAFTDYVDGIKEFNAASDTDTKLRQLDNLAAELFAAK